MIKVSEFLVVLFAASLPVTYVLLMRHYLLKNEAEDLASLAKAGPLEAHECCCETAVKALAAKREAKEAVAQLA
jgi:hypothetical protein